MKVRKELDGFSISLEIFCDSKTCAIKAIVDDSERLFADYDPRFIELKTKMEKLCDEYIEEKRFDYVSSYPTPDFSFRPEAIYIEKLYMKQ